MTADLDAAVLITREGSGHGSYRLSRCVEQAVNAYLIDLTLPAKGLVCPSTDGLFARFIAGAGAAPDPPSEGTPTTAAPAP